MQQPRLDKVLSPNPFDTRETWEHHLAELRQMPDSLFKDQRIAEAEELLERKRRGS
jgi:hypothetical protein